MDDIVEAGRPERARPSRRYAAGLVATGLVGGLVVAGLSGASAQTGPTPAPSASATADPGARDKRDHKRDGTHGGHGGPGGKQGKHGMHGLAGALHGEFTTRAPGGGYRTMAVQRGEATAVSPTSVTVRSEDGFSRTYVVDGETRVLAGAEGIGSIAAGERVHVLAVVTGGTARAVRVVALKDRGVRDRGGKDRGARPRPTPTS